MPNRSFQSPIKNARVHAVINRLAETPRRPPSGGPHNDPAAILILMTTRNTAFRLFPSKAS